MPTSHCPHRLAVLPPRAPSKPTKVGQEREREAGEDGVIAEKGEACAAVGDGSCGHRGESARLSGEHERPSGRLPQPPGSAFVAARRGGGMRGCWRWVMRIGRSSGFHGSRSSSFHRSPVTCESKGRGRCACRTSRKVAFLN